MGGPAPAPGRWAGLRRRWSARAPGQRSGPAARRYPRTGTGYRRRGRHPAGLARIRVPGTARQFAPRTNLPDPGAGDDQDLVLEVAVLVPDGIPVLAGPKPVIGDRRPGP